MIIPWHLFEIIYSNKLQRAGGEAMIKMSSLERDYISSNLRYQVSKLQYVLEDLENEDLDAQRYEYTVDSIKKVEINLHNIRNFLEK